MQSEVSTKKRGHQKKYKGVNRKQILYDNEELHICSKPIKWHQSYVQNDGSVMKTFCTYTRYNWTVCYWFFGNSKVGNWQIANNLYWGIKEWKVNGSELCKQYSLLQKHVNEKHKLYYFDQRAAIICFSLREVHINNNKRTKMSPIKIN